MKIPEKKLFELISDVVIPPVEKIKKIIRLLKSTINCNSIQLLLFEEKIVEAASKLQIPLTDLILIDKNTNERIYIEKQVKSRAKPKLRKFFSFIITSGRENIGLLTIGFQKKQTSLDASKKAFCEQTSSGIAKILNDAYTQIQIITDKETGLYNREYGLEKLTEWMGRRPFIPVILTIFDIDHFKALNGEFGYEGANILRDQVAHVLKQIKPQNTILFRYLHGDEFGFLLKEPKKHVAKKIIKKITLKVNSNYYGLPATNLHMAISGGSAFYPGDAKSSGKLCKCAQSALLMAKKEGGQRVAFYEDYLRLTKKLTDLLETEKKIEDFKDVCRVYYDDFESKDAEECKILLTVQDVKGQRANYIKSLKLTARRSGEKRHFSWIDLSAGKIGAVDASGAKIGQKKFYSNKKEVFYEVVYDHTLKKGENYKLSELISFINCFRGKKQYWGSRVRWKTEKLIIEVRLPRRRPVRTYKAVMQRGFKEMEVKKGVSKEKQTNRTILKIEIPNPVLYDRYRLEWEW